jgi:flagellar biosynthesis/type III secretory pathway protein FliH
MGGVAQVVICLANTRPSSNLTNCQKRKKEGRKEGKKEGRGEGKETGKKGGRERMGEKERTIDASKHVGETEFPNPST